METVVLVASDGVEYKVSSDAATRLSYVKNVLETDKGCAVIPLGEVHSSTMDRIVMPYLRNKFDVVHMRQIRRLSNKRCIEYLKQVSYVGSKDLSDALAMHYEKNFLNSDTFGVDYQYLLKNCDEHLAAYIINFKDRSFWLSVSRKKITALDTVWIRKYEKLVHWSSIQCTLTEDFIREFQHKLDWSWISEYQTLSESFIREFRDRVDWDLISQYQKHLTEEFIREFQDHVDWIFISSHQVLSCEFIREFCHRVRWRSISKNQKLSEEFIRDFKDCVDWWAISRYQILSEDLIRDFKDRVDWNLISKHQILSEEFMDEFQEHVVWENISRYQSLSKKFIRKHRGRVDWYWISQNQPHISRDFVWAKGSICTLVLIKIFCCC